MSKSLGPLEKGHVVIIGGGPGGTACALALHRMAAEMGRDIRLSIVEGKQFVGEMHYNQCVGVLSPPLPDLLNEKLGVRFPYRLCRNQITSYIIHTATGTDLPGRRTTLQRPAQGAIRRIHAGPG